jgi:hypothetical protein
LTGLEKSSQEEQKETKGIIYYHYKKKCICPHLFTHA